MIDKVNKFQKLEVKGDAEELLKEFYEEVTEKEKNAKSCLEYPRIWERVQMIQKEFVEILDRNNK
ncbi:MAG: hypothetical protein IJ958_07925 [Agathobacter sp.]|nr:hypothetical protein [Agathobacter sp.]